MGVEVLISQLKSLFKPDDCNNVIRALHQDQLIWKLIIDLENLEGFKDYAQADLSKWSPGDLALFAIDPTNLLRIDWSMPDSILPEDIRLQSHQSYETIRSTRMIPERVEQAGLLSFHIREYCLEQETWKGISKKLNIRLSNVHDGFYFNLWKTTFACLPRLLPSFQEFSKTLLSETDPKQKNDFISLIVHSILCTPNSPDKTLNLLLDVFGHSDLDDQVISLSILDQFGYPTLAEKSAKAYLSDVKNVELLSEALSYYELDDAPVINQKYYINIQALEKLAELHKFANIPEKSSEILELVSRILAKSQVRMYHQLAITSQKSNTSLAQSYWDQAINAGELSEQMKIDYAEFLISIADDEKAKEYLLQSDPYTKKMFSSQSYTSEIDDTIRMTKTTSLSSIFKDQRSKTIANANKIKKQLSMTLPYLRQADEFRAALNAVDNQLAISPNDEDLLSKSIHLHQQVGELQQAIDKASILDMINPGDTKNKTILADLFSKTQQYEKAFNIHHTLIQASQTPTRDELLNYAQLAVEAGKPDIAIPICNNFLAKDKLDGDALVILGNAYVENGNKSAAIEHMERAASISPEKPSSWLALANIWNRMGEFKKELETLEKGKTALQDNPQILLALGKSYLSNHLPSDALPILIQTLKIDPENIEAKIALAKVFYKLGRTEEAWQAISNIQDKNLSNPELALISGQIQSEFKRHNQAITNLKFSQKTLNTEEALLSLAKELIAFSKKSTEKKAKESASDNDLLEIRNSLEEAKGKSESPFEIELILAEVKSVLGDYEQSYKDYLLLSEKPEAKSPRAYQRIQFGIGKNAYFLKYPEISLAALQEALVNNPNDLEAHHYLAEAFIIAELQEEAFKSARTALHILPEDTSNLLWFSDFMFRNGQSEPCIQALKEAIKFTPNQKELYLTLAKTHMALNNKQEAGAVISQLVSIEDISTNEMLTAANILYKINDLPQASDVLKKAVGKEEEIDFDTLYQLTNSLVNVGEGEEALSLINSQEAQYSGEPIFSIIKSDVLSGLENYSEALLALDPVLKKIEYLPELLKDYKNNEDHVIPVMELSSAGVYWRAAQLERIIGDLLPAKKHANKALTLDPNRSEFINLSGEIAFGLNQKSNIKDLLVIHKTEDDETTKPNQMDNLATKLCLVSILDDDYESANKYFKEFNLDGISSTDSLSIQACLSAHYGEVEIAQNLFDAAENLSQLNNFHQSNSISSIFYQIWQNFSLAISAWNLQKWDLAMKLFEESLAIVKINPIINYSFAKFMLSYENQLTLYQALKVITHSPARNPEDAGIRQQYFEQVSHAKRYLDTNLVENLQNKGDVLFYNSNLEKENLSKLITCHEDAVQLIPLLSDLQDLESILKAYPESQSVKLGYAIKVSSSDSQKSEEIAKQLVLQNPKKPEYHALLAFLAKSRDLSIESMEKALSFWEDEPEWHGFVAEKYLSAQQYKDASSHLEKAISIDPENSRYWQAIGEVKLEEKDINAAKNYFAKAYEIFPKNPKVLHALSEINYRLGDFSAAIDCLNKAEKLEPSEKSHQEAIATLYYKQDDFGKAIEKASHIIRNNPDCTPAKVILINSYIKNGKMDLAKTTLNSVSVQEANSAEIKLAEIELIEAEQGTAAALTYAIDLAAKFQENTNVINKLGTLLIEAGRQDQAEKALYHSLEIDPDQASVYLMLGRINRKNGNLDQAISQLSKAILSDPTQIDAYLELGKTHQERREHSSAIQIYKQAIDLVKNNPRLYYQAGIAYKESRDYRNAEAMFRKAASLSPEDTNIRRQLAAVVTLNLVHNIQENKRK